ncbi:MAG: hypothetical protein JXR29_13795, partial [Methylothermaceae bacterium]|nr:hypothetical protein [Methylothermaceae bacterium]
KIRCEYFTKPCFAIPQHARIQVFLTILLDMMGFPEYFCQFIPSLENATPTLLSVEQVGEAV